MSEKWMNVGDETDFPVGLKMVTVAGRRLVVARLQGRLYAFDALCPHAGGPMERSEVDGAIVSCPLHAWRFDLGKGGAELHGYRALALKNVKTENGAVYVAIQA
jgi:nitrite reductase/ring-hydroxylating ferredoxin subunit